MSLTSIFGQVKEAFGGKKKHIAELKHSNEGLTNQVEDLDEQLQASKKANATLQSENDTLKGELKKISDYLTEED